MTPLSESKKVYRAEVGERTRTGAPNALRLAVWLQVSSAWWEKLSPLGQIARGMFGAVDRQLSKCDAYGTPSVPTRCKNLLRKP